MESLQGSTTEFYKFFWSDLKYFAVRSFNQAYTRGYLSVSQRQGVISNQWIIEGPNPQNSKDLRIKFHSTESKAFSKSSSIKTPGILFSSHFSKKSHISLVHSPMKRTPFHDLKYFAVRSFNQAYTRGYLSVSQRQGVITCLPKEGKSKFYLKNWRPISLLNVDYKMCASAQTPKILKICE
jgi:hypothetical protein